MLAQPILCYDSLYYVIVSITMLNTLTIKYKLTRWYGDGKECTFAEYYVCSRDNLSLLTFCRFIIRRF